MNKKTTSIAAIALVIGFSAGYFLHPSPAQAPGASGNFARNGGAAGGMMRGGGFLSGTVATKDSESITVNTRDGSSHVVLVTPATNVSKSVSGAMSDISIGSEVIVSGAANGDGSLSANLIQLRPAVPAVQPQQ